MCFHKQPIANLTTLIEQSKFKKTELNIQVYSFHFRSYKAILRGIFYNSKNLTFFKNNPPGVDLLPHFNTLKLIEIYKDIKFIPS